MSDFGLRPDRPVNDIPTWLRSLPIWVAVVMLAAGVSLVAFGVAYTLHEVGSTPAYGLNPCLEAANDNQRARAQCFDPDPPWYVRWPALTAVVVGILSMPLWWRSLRPWHR